ncbi:hypothetical protein IW262DRAFT_1302024 [Armillaria fumosa]|nr:hypothetical protein IW262DRAFT_1302024 [Armillaria fumosa]
MTDVGSANMGLAYPSWYNCAPYLCSLQWLMQRWTGSKPDIIAKDRTSWLWTEAEIYELEKPFTLPAISICALELLPVTANGNLLPKPEPNSHGLLFPSTPVTEWFPPDGNDLWS